jgi:hypothetical protein
MKYSDKHIQNKIKRANLYTMTLACATWACLVHIVRTEVALFIRAHKLHTDPNPSKEKVSRQSQTVNLQIPKASKLQGHDIAKLRNTLKDTSQGGHPESDNGKQQ